MGLIVDSNVFISFESEAEAVAGGAVEVKWNWSGDGSFTRCVLHFLWTDIRLEQR